MLNLRRRAMQVFGVLAMSLITSSGAFAQKIVVAHRGASGYLPEHTLEAKAMVKEKIEKRFMLLQKLQALVWIT